MKKLLWILVLGLLLSGNAYATKITKGKGELKLYDETIELFHVYLTQKFTKKSCSEFYDSKQLKLCGWGFGEKEKYGSYFFIFAESIGQILGPQMSPLLLDTRTWYIGCHKLGSRKDRCRIFAIDNEIVWKGFKKTIPRDISLDELKLTLKKLGIQSLGAW